METKENNRGCGKKCFVNTLGDSFVCGITAIDGNAWLCDDCVGLSIFMNKHLTKEQIKVALISNDYCCFNIVDRNSIWVVTVEDETFSLPSEMDDYIMSFSVRDGKVIIYLRKESLI